MTKDYVPISTEYFNIFGHKVKVITERFSDEYLDSDRFEPRCFRCCFNNSKFCSYIKCSRYSYDLGVHFEIAE